MFTGFDSQWSIESDRLRSKTKDTESDDRQTYRQNDRQKNRTPPLFQDKPPLFITSF